MDFAHCILSPLTNETADEISSWAYDCPYDVYDFKGRSNGYLFDEKTWGIEQFCLMDGSLVIGQVACQFEDHLMWVGWSLAPSLCNQGNGCSFIQKCIFELCKIKEYKGEILLRVAAWNERAIKSYEKAGFVYEETIIDEIAYSKKMEDFWVMKYAGHI
jgi:[ribosomal protein S18]-alanine N-acetyltransferase